MNQYERAVLQGMKQGKGIYYVISAIVLLATGLIAAYEYGNMGKLFAGESLLSLAILIMTAIFVHMAKSARLYLALYGHGVGAVEYAKAYCMSTIVSIVLPFKLGDLFRMFCYGGILASAIRGIVIVLLDRFMDTVALLSFILFARVAAGWGVSAVAYILIAFLALVLFAYHGFPGLSEFWRKYLIRARATRRKLSLLAVMEKLSGIYDETWSILRGRGMIMYFMSVAAWGVEIGGLFARNAISGKGQIGSMVSDYLESAIGGGQTAVLRQFVIISIALLVCAYMAVKAREVWRSHGGYSGI